MNKTLTGIAFCVAAALTACGGGGATIGGTVSGLANGATVTLQDNGTDTVTVAANGAFTFAADVAGGGTYAVVILTQPAGQSCAVANGAGAVDATADPVSNVAVSCVTNVSVAGVVSGLTPGTAVTLSEGGQDLPVAVNGAFAFPGLLPTGTAYTVTIKTQPIGETCTVANGTGISAATPTPVVVTCS